MSVHEVEVVLRFCHSRGGVVVHVILLDELSRFAIECKMLEFDM